MSSGTFHVDDAERVWVSFPEFAVLLMLSPDECRTFRYELGRGTDEKPPLGLHRIRRRVGPRLYEVEELDEPQSITTVGNLRLRDDWEEEDLVVTGQPTGEQMTYILDTGISIEPTRWFEMTPL